MGHLVIEANEVGQAEPAFCEPMLAEPDPTVILNLPCTQDELVHNIPQYWGQADRPGIPWILLSAIFVDVCHVLLLHEKALLRGMKYQL